MMKFLLNILIGLAKGLKGAVQNGTDLSGSFVKFTSMKTA